MRKRLMCLVLLSAAILVIVEIPVFAANQVVIHVDDDAKPGWKGSVKFPTTIYLRRSLPRHFQRGGDHAGMRGTLAVTEEGTWAAWLYDYTLPVGRRAA